MHVVQLEIGIGREQGRAMDAPPLERSPRLVGIEMGPHGNQERLRQPRNAEGRPQVHGRAVRRADRDRWILAPGILVDGPTRQRLRADFAELLGGNRFHPSRDAVDRFTQSSGDPVEGSRQRLEGRRPDPEPREVTPVEIGAERANHRRRGVEVGEGVLRLHAARRVSGRHSGATK